MINIVTKKLPNKGYFKFNLLFPTFVFAESNNLHHGKVFTKEVSFITKISLTGNPTYAKLILSLFGFGIQIEIKE